MISQKLQFGACVFNSPGAVYHLVVSPFFFKGLTQKRVNPKLQVAVLQFGVESFQVFVGLFVVFVCKSKSCGSLKRSKLNI